MRIGRTLVFLTVAAIAGGAHEASADEPAWAASAAAFVPKDYVAGSAYRTDETAMRGYLAVFPASANDPKTPGSAFDWGHTLVVTLANDGGTLKATSGELKKREPDNAAQSHAREKVFSASSDEADYLTLHRAMLEQASTLPAGTTPCSFGAWSNDKDPKGLNVRAEPNAQGKIAGTLPPPFRFKAKDQSENTPDGGWLTEFNVIGYRDGWFLIEGAEPPGKRYEQEKAYPKNPPKPYAGRGWVAGNKIGANYANGDTRMGGLFHAPHVDAKWMPAQGQFGGEISADGGPRRILACSGFWALVESQDGVRGWWRRLCSNQVTNCS